MADVYKRQLLGQTKGSDTIVFLYDEKANKFGFDYNGTKYYYIFNVQGDVIGILNQAGQKIVSYTYDPWGKVLSVDGSEASAIGQLNPIRYRGYYYDTETGFYYLQSRYYDPTVRRFLNADNILGANQNILSYNLFAYCSNKMCIRDSYNPDGIRTSKTENGTTTKCHVMNGTLLGQTKGNDTIVFLYDEKANKYGFDYNGTKYYYIFNVQGDVIGILNQAGQKLSLIHI